MEEQRSWHADEVNRHCGRRIVEVRSLSDLEIAGEGWEHHDPGQTVVLILDDGSALLSQSDPEGNGPGYLRSARIIR